MDHSSAIACSIFGIPHCATMKKALAWLMEHGVAFEFVDYQKADIGVRRLAAWSERVGWRSLLNTRGTTWRRLAEADRSDLTRERAISLMGAYPTLIKRPVLEAGNLLLVGFNERRYTEALLCRAN